MTALAAKYDASAITLLEGLEPVRKRPSMYIGSTDSKGLHHLVWEIVDNSVDEYLNGHADEVHVTLHKSHDAVTVRDNGRGIPVDLHPKHHKPALELILTTLHSGGKFGENESYIHSGGLHGVGSSVVNALSRSLVATIARDGAEWRQAYSRGLPLGPLERVANTRRHGTAIYFEPDEQIFRTTKLDADWVKSHLEDMAYIHAGLKILFTDEATGVTHDLAHPGGLSEFLTRLVSEAGKPAVTESAFTFTKATGERVDLALQWTEATGEAFRSYVNGIRTPAGGTHENGLKSAILKAVRNHIATHEIKVKGLDIGPDDIREGVVAVLSVFVREPMFQGQTKERLNNPELTAAVEGLVRPALENWLNANPSAADAVIGRVILAARARAASRAAGEEIKRKSLTSRRLNLPGKLADCKSNELEESELFIVEGDSAGGSAKQGRNNKTQAVLPLRGKVLNSEGLTTAKVLGNTELNDLVSALGTGAGDKFEIKGLRYGKVILLMDADADGHHISTLLLDFFFRHMKDLITRGHVYLAQPPLYRIDVGRETHWAMDDADKEAILAKLKANAKPEITRFKGLGEMDAKVLADTTLDPRYRTLLRVEIDSVVEADETFDHLLGKEPAHRYDFIMREAGQAGADDLDV